MKTLRQIAGALLSIIILSTACTKNFDTINDDPNRPKASTPGVMLGQLQYRMVNSTINQGRNFTHQLMQVDAPRASTNGQGLHRYVVNPGQAVWSDFYQYLTDIEDIYTIADSLKETNYQAISLVYKCWAYSILTDLYGNVPYSEATKGAAGNFLPRFDKQADIYPQMLADLDKANSLFVKKALTYGGDMVYSANPGGKDPAAAIGKWQKFANSLKLRLLLRILKRDGEVNVTAQINDILSNPTTRPLFAANEDEAIFRYPGTFPYYNPFYNTRQLEWRDGDYFSLFFMNKLNTDVDPRRAVWATKVKKNNVDTFSGIESGYPTTVEYAVGANSSYPDALKTYQDLGVMMTYAEVEFIKAELALRGFTTGGSAQQHYEKGIAASMRQWGVSMPADFTSRPGVAYNTGASFEGQLEQIMLQKYIAYFFTDYQSWFEKRRTGYPVLPRGSGIPAENKFPARVPYPTYLQSLNAQSLEEAVAGMGGDNSDIKVWWDK
ncbi:MAG: SusD/RagB family nutrient-binding outer membrane lipoprotein [Candidatus Pseudobacter hemicellulosilyticus]|uniref:SusD/RagB family nutrient-binding outer membrane lipoprotein n=1 Tax=Candidatus Pseudobacter hemicellulosilyticus TaxID=3121375 RepID=A0AAJ5WRM2_9BACT|nr:MAG: SusD/RagB family nutrient-binding outer membrane lipoprotein [Pseudobacter sp.]